MGTLKLLPALITVAAVLALLPEPAEAGPSGQSHSFRRDHRGWKKKNNVPELSIGAAAAALGLLGGGLMVMTGRRRAKRD